MAKRPATTITDAKLIAERIKADAVVVIGFRDGEIHASSYGSTKQQCAVTGKWVDMIVRGLETGNIEAPDL